MAGQYEGPWRGMKVHIIDSSVYQLIGEGKWVNIWIMIKKWLQKVALGEPLDYTELQSYPGLLNYVFDTYRSCRPFLEGMHITLDSWSPYWDSEG